MPTTKKPAPKKAAASKKAAAPKHAPAREQGKAAAPKHAPAREQGKDEAKEEPRAAGKAGTYFFAVGRRKSAVAQTRMVTDGKGEITVNKRSMESFFPVIEYRETVIAPLKACGQEGKVSIAFTISGGGPRGQADAARLGVSRALLKLNADYRATLKPLGFLTRDARVKERKKPGLKKARRAPQWAKR